jgi:hypothetical protein
MITIRKEMVMVIKNNQVLDIGRERKKERKGKIQMLERKV